MNKKIYTRKGFIEIIENEGKSFDTIEIYDTIDGGYKHNASIYVRDEREMDGVRPTFRNVKR